ncbi:MAG: hypothetical protein QM740_10160 [Acidovorax sp.]
MNLPAMPRRRLLQTALLPVAAPLLALGGCATAAPNSATDREALLTRAREFWKAVQADDLVTAWKYEQISKNPKATLQNYLKRDGGILYETVEVAGVISIDGDQALVDVKTTYSVPVIRATGIKGVLQDPWVRLEGQWYHAPKISG